MMVGLGVDAVGRAHVPTVVSSGATAVRVPLMLQAPDGHPVDVRANVQRYAAAGLRVLGLFIRESLRKNGQERAALDAARELASLVGPSLWAVELGNEPDDPGSSSWTMTPADFGAFLANLAPIWRASNPHLVVVSGGLSTGQPGWLGQVNLAAVDAVGCHLYNERPEPSWPASGWGNGNAIALLDGYLAASGGRPLWITEWGTTDASLQAEYVTRSLPAYAAHAAVDAAFYFQYDDSVPPFGLFDGSNQPKPAWAAFQAAAKHLSAPQPTPGGTPHMASMDDLYKAVWTAGGTSVPYNPQAAICKHWLDLTRSGDPIGIPVTNEIDVGGGHTGQGFSSGRRLIWQGGDQVAEG